MHSSLFLNPNCSGRITFFSILHFEILVATIFDKILIPLLISHSLSKDYWKNSYIPKYIIEKKHSEWEINQEISKEEIKAAILSTPNYKASGPDDIPIEFYKAMLSDNDSDSNSGLEFLYKFYNVLKKDDLMNLLGKSH
ncbi:hypothetical protein PIROE2DRAFT_16411 [Piromyces sp. E2]|nr:hypothetical protein PIROE2DRAFT_16411 [Piromyces sp. E2]|eukprot:OUM58343.1 hypothetical protein PIROE2DRAFT_16411 [Piromyces sp. E2]